MKMMTELSKSLEILEWAVHLQLGKRSCPLLTAYVVFIVLLQKLRGQKDEVSKDLSTAVKGQIEKKRNKELASIITYLDDPKLYDWHIASSELKFLSKSETIDKSRKLFLRLFGSTQEETLENNNDEEKTADPMTFSMMNWTCFWLQGKREKLQALNRIHPQWC